MVIIILISLLNSLYWSFIFIMNFRAELASCCDAMHNFIASQNNTPLGSNMSYEVDNKKTIHITEDIFQMLPEVRKALMFIRYHKQSSIGPIRGEERISFEFSYDKNIFFKKKVLFYSALSQT